MACTPGVNQTTVTVQAPTPSKPTVTAFVATSRNDVAGTIDFSWNQNIAGNVQLFANGTPYNTYNGVAGSNKWSLSGFGVGTFNMCLDAV